MSGKWYHSPRSVSQTCPHLRVRRWQRRGAKPGGTPKRRASHPLASGQGKMGRVSVSESSMRSRHSSMPESVADQDGILSQGRGSAVTTSSRSGRASVVEGHRGSGIKRTPTPIASRPCGTWKPRCGLPPERTTHTRGSQPAVRMAQFRSRTGRPKKRKPAAERQGESITRWTGPQKRRYPSRKGADVGLVNHRKSMTKSANRGKS
jgi:hypothetical protein